MWRAEAEAEAVRVLILIHRWTGVASFNLQHSSVDIYWVSSTSIGSNILAGNRIAVIKLLYWLGYFRSSYKTGPENLYILGVDYSYPSWTEIMLGGNWSFSTTYL
jgi:hypothetical protein